MIRAIISCFALFAFCVNAADKYTSITIDDQTDVDISGLSYVKSDTSNIVIRAGIGGTTFQVVLHNLDTDTSQVISQTEGGELSDGTISDADINRDGDIVYFLSNSQNLRDTDTSLRLVYFYDTDTDTLDYIKTNTAELPNRDILQFAMVRGTDDFLYLSEASNITDEHTTTQLRLYRYDFASKTSTVVSSNVSGRRILDTSDDGSITLLTYSSTSSCPQKAIIVDANQEEVIPINVPYTSIYSCSKFSGIVSEDGSQVIYVPNNNYSSAETAYEYDIATGETSELPLPEELGTSDFNLLGISSDNSELLLATYAFAQRSQIWLVDLSELSFNNVAIDESGGFASYAFHTKSDFHFNDASPHIGFTFNQNQIAIVDTSLSRPVPQISLQTLPLRQVKPEK